MLLYVVLQRKEIHCLSTIQWQMSRAPFLSFRPYPASHILLYISTYYGKNATCDKNSNSAQSCTHIGDRFHIYFLGLPAQKLLHTRLQVYVSPPQAFWILPALSILPSHGDENLIRQQITLIKRISLLELRHFILLHDWHSDSYPSLQAAYDYPMLRCLGNRSWPIQTRFTASTTNGISR
jgi:hypothetical protein